MTTSEELKKERLYVRLSPHPRDVISEAAEVAQKDVSAFVLAAVLAEADRILTGRRTFDLSDGRWEAFIAALERDLTPSQVALQALLEEPSLLER